jgi:hypothetical protein
VGAKVYELLPGVATPRKVAAPDWSRRNQRRVRPHGERLSERDRAQRHSRRDLVGARISRSREGKLEAGTRDRLADGNPRAGAVSGWSTAAANNTVSAGSEDQDFTFHA